MRHTLGPVGKVIGAERKHLETQVKLIRKARREKQN